MATCAQCSSELADDFRFCPHCGVIQRTKVVEYFRGHSDIDDGWLRVSAYLSTPRHLRLSVWRNDEAEAAISLDPDEAHRLGRFLFTITRPHQGHRVRHSLWRSARALRDALSAPR